MNEEVNITDCLDSLEGCLKNLKIIVRKIESVHSSMALRDDVADIESEVEKMISHVENLEIEPKDK